MTRVGSQPHRKEKNIYIYIYVCVCVCVCVCVFSVGCVARLDGQERCVWRFGGKSERKNRCGRPSHSCEDT
jgi:hypothetical protein